MKSPKGIAASRSASSMALCCHSVLVCSRSLTVFLKKIKRTKKSAAKTRVTTQLEMNETAGLSCGMKSTGMPMAMKTEARTTMVFHHAMRRFKLTAILQMIRFDCPMERPCFPAQK